MPAEQGKDEMRFAAAIEQGRPPGSVGDAELARDLEIVAMLRSQGAAFAPRAEEKARARQRLMAMLAEPDGRGPRPPAPPVPAASVPTAQERTAPIGRIRTSPEPPTTVIPAVVASAEPDDVDDTVLAGRAGRRAGRHTLPSGMSSGMSSRPAGRAGATRRSASHSLRRRGVVLGAAAMVLLAALTGGGVFASRNALPGDGLYGVKRAAESAGLAMTFDDAAKAHRHLELATTRLDEVEQMVAGDPGEAADPELVRTAMRDFDTDTGEGSRGLLAGSDAGDTSDAAALSDLRAWAAEQAARISVLRSSLPTPAVSGADDSIDLLDRLLGRTEALRDRSSCTEVTSGAVDDLGPQPAEGSCTARPADPGSRRSGGTGSTGGREDVTSGVDTPGPATGNDVTGTQDPTTVPETSTGDEQAPGLLPGLTTDSGSGDGRGTEGGPSSTTSTTTSAPSGEGNVSVPLPLPLLPPITLPPLVPGLPGVTIG